MTIRVTYNTEDIATYISLSYENPAIDAVWGQISGTLSNQTDLQNALDAKVPYSGATANVDLGEFELKAGQLELDQTPTGTAGVAVTRWNDSLGTIETTLKGGNVVLRHGRDMFERVVNKTGVQLTKAAYQAVRVSDAQGQRLAVQLAQANNDNNSADTIGLVVETIDNNQEGMIFTVGEIEGVNTTGSLQGETWLDGDVLYLSPTTAGRITNVKPTAPQHLVIIGYVVYAHANNGKIYVKVMNGWELGELHDVDTTGATNGQVLKYNGTIWTPSGDVGITSLNGLNATSQTFATGSSGTDFNISSATSTHTFNLPTASGTNRGLLSSADWSTFNSKQNALTNPITGTGTTNYLPKFTGATTLGNSLLREGANSIAFNMTPSDWGSTLNAIEIARTAVFSGQPGVETMRLGSNFYFNSGFKYQINGFATRYDQASGNHSWFTAPENTSGVGAAITFTERMRLFNNGNLLLQAGGTFTDSGQRLQVTGDTLLKGSGNTSATTALLVENSDAFDLFTVLNNGYTRYGNAGNNAFRVYPSSVASSGDVDLSGLFLTLNSRVSTTETGSSAGFVHINGLTSTGTSGVQNVLSIQKGFAPTSGTAFHNSLIINPAINQTGGANGITRGLYVNPTLTAAADWRSIEWSNNTGWGLRGEGTAPNLLRGNLLINSTNNFAKLYVGGLTTAATDQAAAFVQQDINGAITGTLWMYRSNVLSSAAVSIANIVHYGADQSSISSTTTTNQFGFRVDANLTGATNNYGFYGNIASATGRWNLYMNGTALNYINSSLLIGSTTSTGEALQVTGTAKITGASSFGGNMTLSLNQNAVTRIIISNTTSGTTSASQLQLTSDSASGSASFAKYSSTTNPYKILAASDAYIYNGTAGDIAILNDFASGNIKFAAGASSTAQWTITSAGNLQGADGENLIFGTTTGTKIGTATSQKIGFWNATPIVQPTTAVAEATFVENSGGTAVNVDSTFDGYTMQQVVKALRNAGLLA